MGKFVVKETKTGINFDLKATNGQIISTGGEGYKTLKACLNGVESIRKNSVDTPIVEEK